ncbi:MAG: preprotein translocase subunit TatC [Phycisphaerae bacterium]|nr:preprotein translocase subunit TatC [Phycisphaerae bacterium]
MALFRRKAILNPDESRMTLGEHLEELRGCLGRCLIALVLACLACIWPAKYLLELIARPMVLALRRHGQPDSFLATGPVESLMVYIKVVLIFGVVIAGPYIIYQLWKFVAAGLYRHERKWVWQIVPVSVGLFFAGVAFMYIFALLLSLNFLVGFSGWLPLPKASPNAIERALLDMPEFVAPASQPGMAQAPVVPLLEADPCDPPVGTIWVNMPDGKLKVRWPQETYSFQLLRDDRRAMVTTHFKIGEYLSFVLILTVAFGTAFQMPLVVVFLARAGIVSVATFRKYRKIVIVVIVFMAGLLAPPDLMSHLLLSGPMIVLFELGLWLAARGARDEPEPGSDEPDGAAATGRAGGPGEPAGVTPEGPAEGSGS